MRFGAFQFRATGSLAGNLCAIERGIQSAAEREARVLLTQECALTGYPPVERRTADDLDTGEIDRAVERVQAWSSKHDMVIALGTILMDEGRRRNSIVVITPDPGERQIYHKRALWGWDVENFVPGNDSGIFCVDGVRIGIRICFEIRFPEYFRELFRADVDVALVSFCDVADAQDRERCEILRGHLVTRAVENAFYVISANSISKVQTAPTCVITPDGHIAGVAPATEEYLLWHDCERGEPGYGRKGRIVLSRRLLGM